MSADSKKLEYLIKEGLVRISPDDSDYIVIKSFTNPRAHLSTKAQTSEYVVKISDFMIAMGSLNLTAHINDLIAAHIASAIANSPTGNLLATDVQAALAELDADLTAHITQLVGAHLATAISYDNLVSGLTAIEVQAAIDELAGLIPPASPASSYDLLTAAAFVTLTGDDLTTTAPQYFPTGDVGYITTETGTQTFGSGALITGAVAVTAVADVASLKATLIALPGTDVTPTAAALETTNVGYGVGTFVPGVYTTAAALGVTAKSTITLDGDGDYVFISTAGALVFGVNVTILLTNGAKASKVFWVASADLTTGANDKLKGNFLTTAITIGSTNTIEGRLLGSGDVVIDGTATGIYLPA